MAAFLLAITGRKESLQELKRCARAERKQFLELRLFECSYCSLLLLCCWVRPTLSLLMEEDGRESSNTGRRNATHSQFSCLTHAKSVKKRGSRSSVKSVRKKCSWRTSNFDIFGQFILVSESQFAVALDDRGGKILSQRHEWRFGRRTSWERCFQVSFQKCIYTQHRYPECRPSYSSGPILTPCQTPKIIMYVALGII